MAIQLKDNEVFVGCFKPATFGKPSFGPGNSSSLDRLAMLGSRDFQNENKISRILYLGWTETMPVSLGPLYLRQGTDYPTGRLLDKGDESEIVSPSPMCIIFNDGGFEYLSDIVGKATDSPEYKNGLVLPNGARWKFYHPIKDEELKALVSGKYESA